MNSIGWPRRHAPSLAAYKTSDCPKCGAIRVDQQIGLEETPEEFVAKLVAVFREARRVLRDDGVAFINIGDSYAGSGKGGNPEAGKQATNAGSQSVGVLYGTGVTAREAAVTNVTRRTFDGIKAKDLIGIPWMLAFALRADGWYLRQEIIWAKPNPMPESVRDRCTKSHEHVFLLSKSQRYLFDAEAISEEATNREPGNKTHKMAEAYADGDEHHRTKGGLARDWSSRDPQQARRLDHRHRTELDCSLRDDADRIGKDLHHGRLPAWRNGTRYVRGRRDHGAGGR
jgi:hypothetical protein